MNAMRNSEMATLLRDVAKNIDKIGDTSEIDRKNTTVELRRLIPIFEEHFVASKDDTRRMAVDAFLKGFKKG